MESFEVPRWEQAKADFEKAFARGYAAGLQALERGEVAQDASTSSVFYVDVDRDDIVDGEHSAWEPRFEEAGFQAAIAKRREGQARLDHEWAHPDGREARMNGRCRWTVILRP